MPDEEVELWGRAQGARLREGGMLWKANMPLFPLHPETPLRQANDGMARGKRDASHDTNKRGARRAESWLHGSFLTSFLLLPTPLGLCFPYIRIYHHFRIKKKRQI